MGKKLKKQLNSIVYFIEMECPAAVIASDLKIKKEVEVEMVLVNMLSYYLFWDCMAYVSICVSGGEGALTTRKIIVAVDRHPFGLTGDNVEEMEHCFKNIQNVDLIIK